MRKQITRVLATTAVAAAAITATAAPSMAATSTVAAGVHRAGDVPGPPPANETRTSHTSQNAWSSWDKAGGEVGSGAAGLISAAFFGIPAWILDTVQGILRAL
jgi:hypothetical protein